MRVELVDDDRCGVKWLLFALDGVQTVQPPGLLKMVLQSMPHNLLLVLNKHLGIVAVPFLDGPPQNLILQNEHKLCESVSNLVHH